METRKATERRPTSAGVNVAPAVYYLVGLLAGFGFDLAVDAEPSLPGWVKKVGGALVVGGGGVLLAGLVTLWRAGTAIDPMKTSTALVTHGVYGLTRNPGYLGSSVLYAGVALLGGSLASLLLLPAVIAFVGRFVVRREEAYLRQVFGTSYEDYCSRVRRWL